MAELRFLPLVCHDNFAAIIASKTYVSKKKKTNKNRIKKIYS